MAAKPACETEPARTPLHGWSSLYTPAVIDADVVTAVRRGLFSAHARPRADHCAQQEGAYELSKTPGAPTGASFPTNFKDYPGGVESFDVYHGPITTQYSQIWWASTSNPLPDDLVQRFDGKAIAIVGLEMDQVRKTPRGDVPVPINVAYNHHHDTAVVGKGSHLVEVERDDPRFVKAGS